MICHRSIDCLSVCVQASAVTLYVNIRSMAAADPGSRTFPSSFRQFLWCKRRQTMASCNPLQTIVSAGWTTAIVVLPKTIAEIGSSWDATPLRQDIIKRSYFAFWPLPLALWKITNRTQEQTRLSIISNRNFLCSSALLGTHRVFFLQAERYVSSSHSAFVLQRVCVKDDPNFDPWYSLATACRCLCLLYSVTAPLLSEERSCVLSTCSLFLDVTDHVVTTIIDIIIIGTMMIIRSSLSDFQWELWNNAMWFLFCLWSLLQEDYFHPVHCCLVPLSIRVFRVSPSVRVLLRHSLIFRLWRKICHFWSSQLWSVTSRQRTNSSQPLVRTGAVWCLQIEAIQEIKKSKSFVFFTQGLTNGTGFSLFSVSLVRTQFSSTIKTDGQEGDHVRSVLHRHLILLAPTVVSCPQEGKLAANFLHTFDLWWDFWFASGQFRVIAHLSAGAFFCVIFDGNTRGDGDITILGHVCFRLSFFHKSGHITSWCQMMVRSLCGLLSDCLYWPQCSWIVTDCHAYPNFMILRSSAVPIRISGFR